MLNVIVMKDFTNMKIMEISETLGKKYDIQNALWMGKKKEF